MTRQVNQAGVNLVKTFEGCVLKAYPDPASGGDPWTIGYGHTGPEVKPGLSITQGQADAYLASDLAAFGAGVVKLCPVATDNQFAALVSFAYNLGLGSLKDSTLRRMHNEGDHTGAAGQFGRWNKARGKIMAGLTKRRAAEAKVYLA